MSDIQSIGFGVSYVMLGVAVLLLSKLLKDALTPYKIDEELTVKDNPALGLVLFGYFAGVTIVFLGATIGPDPDVAPTFGEIVKILGIDLAYCIGGMFALAIGRIILDKISLPSFSTTKEIIEDRNAGTAAVECGGMIATALVVAGAIHGETGGPVSALVFFVIGQIVLIIFGKLYQAVLKYDVHAEIEKDNVAAGVALGFNLVAMGIILLKGIHGDIFSWQEKLTWFGIEVGIGIVLLLVLRKITDALFLPNTTIGHEIANDKNINAAWIEGIIATSVATMIFFVI